MLLEEGEFRKLAMYNPYKHMDTICPSQGFAKEFKRAWMNFTHVERVAYIPLDLTPREGENSSWDRMRLQWQDLVFKLMRQSAILQITDPSSPFKFVLPIYFGRPDFEFDKGNVSAVFVCLRDEFHHLDRATYEAS